MSGPAGRSAHDVAAALPSVLAERDRDAFARLLADDVRWGGEDDTEQTCHDREQVADAYAALLASGTHLTLLSSREGADQVLARLQVHHAGPGADAGYETQVLLSVRAGLIADILQLDAEEPPVVELLFFAGCPNHDAFLPHLQQLLRSQHVHSPVQLVEVRDDQTARRLRFLGSPSLRIDGQDVEPGADDRSGYGLQCRIYSTLVGPAGSPPDSWILDALRSSTRRAATGARF